jgi:hypothetical protein
MTAHPGRLHRLPITPVTRVSLLPDHSMLEVGWTLAVQGT